MTYTALNQREETRPGEVDGGPAAARIRLGTRLRRLRGEADRSREEAGTAIRSSASKIARVELGRTAIKTTDLTDLLAFYGASDEAERESLLELSRHGSVPDWWRQYGDAVPAWTRPYLGLEQAATLIRSYDAHLIPDLLQTPDYARAVIGLPSGPAGERTARRASRADRADWAERRLAVRLRRQEVLHRAEPPRLWAVIDEAALRRPVGGPGVMRAQLEHLTELAELRHVNIQILPFRAGGHALRGGSVILLRFAQEQQLRDVVYLEQLTSASYPSGPSEVASYESMLDHLAAEADPPIASTMMLNQLRWGL